MKRKWISTLAMGYIAVLGCIWLLTWFGNKQITVMAESKPLQERTCFIIDAGHGGEDGGAVSCTGVYESMINLEIAIRLNDLLRLMGYDTFMIRTEDVSVYTNGNTIAQKKISDLKERVRLINNTEKGILISIHQNYFSDDRYKGSQVFYSEHEESKKLAEHMQQMLVDTLDPKNNRKCKESRGVYLMQQVKCPAVLIECGFLSNRGEEALLRDSGYQKKLCCAIAACVAEFANT